jgi:hypothetical protein
LESVRALAGLAKGKPKLTRNPTMRLTSTAKSGQLAQFWAGLARARVAKWLGAAGLSLVLASGWAGTPAVRSDDQPVISQSTAKGSVDQSAQQKNKRRKSKIRQIGARMPGQDQQAILGARNRTDAEPEKTFSLSDIPAPASDPAWPTWTAFDDPAREPVSPPIGFYDLVRPPYGVTPQEEGQEYQRHVASEADLDFNLATCPQPISIYRPDGIAPAGVIGDHTLNTLGRVMFSYRFNDVSFSGLRNGSHSVSTGSALQQFPIVPVSGSAQNNLIIMEYGVTDDLTFQGILPIIQRHFNYVDGSGNHYTTNVEDLSDIQLSALYVVHRTENEQVHLNLGMQIPTGILLEQGSKATPTSPAFTYPVRSSDGTWDFLPGITYRGQSEDWTWGVQALGIIRFGINRYDYRLGDEGNFNAWLSRKLTNSTSLSARLNGHVMGNIFGADPQLNPNLVPSNMPSLQANRQLNIMFGLNYVIPDGFLKGQRLGVEGGIPVYQWLAGPELGQQYQIWTNLTILF